MMAVFVPAAAPVVAIAATVAAIAVGALWAATVTTDVAVRIAAAVTAVAVGALYAAAVTADIIEASVFAAVIADTVPVIVGKIAACRGGGCCTVVACRGCRIFIANRTC